jgi:murein DD-endopeptidase MepM/ murein hydrolase activator NlpD
MRRVHESKKPWIYFLAQILLISGVLVGAFVIHLTFANGASIDALEAEIRERNEKLAELEAEIAEYEKELDKIGADRKTLEAEIARLDTSRKKLATDIAITENRIATANLELEDLGNEINDKERRIREGKRVIEKSLRSLAKINDTTIAEHILASTALTDMWEETDRLRQVQSALSEEVTLLTATRIALITDYETVAQKQGQLVSFQKELSGQKNVLDTTRRTQNSLLTETRNTERTFQDILDERREARQQLEAEIRDFEAQISYTLDPSQIPTAGSGVLKFPFDPSFMQRCVEREATFGNLYCLTQYFGNTKFAQSGAYNGRGHNGIDFGASEGTKIVSALSGVVRATGNTDEIRGCYSYGKWILVEHPNNLATLYAHLSHIAVSPGEPVATGSLLGYSGNTGYSTGPHLHFTVYVANQVQIVRLGDIKTRTNCANARIPVAPTEAYLNPLQYL